MKVLIRSVRIIDKGAALNGQTTDILIEDGIITQIGNDVEASEARVVNGEGLSVSAGWVDMRVASRDPGFEHIGESGSGTWRVYRDCSHA
jgi:dihydroorotase